MAFRGKKIADVYVELNLDKDELRRGMAAAAGDMSADADRVGKQLGDRMTAGIAQKVEALSAKVVKSRQAEAKAADAVQLAELRLSEARDKGGQKASTLLALEQKLTQAQLKLADSSRAASVATSQHEVAQRRLGQAMADDIENIGKKIGPDAERAGDDAGGKLAMGMRLSFIRNSPLIVAAVGGALVAGAPLMMAAAVGLFAGIGVVAAAQSDKVKQAWVGTWQQIKAETIQSASVIEPALTRVAGNVGKAFEQMRPQVQNAFSAAAPQIEVFAGGVTKLAENALPGLVRAVQAGMPVTQGLADLLARTGTGLSDFFDKINTHGPAAGMVFSQLGTTMGIVLPMLGQLVGQGVELGATVLPLLNSGLGLALHVLEMTGGALPAVIAGFSAFRTLQTVGGWADGLGKSLSKLGTSDIPLVSSAAGKMGSALSAGGAAAAAGGPVVAALAVTVGLLMAAHQQGEERVRAWTQALNDGGAAAARAREEMAAQDTQVRKATSGWQGFVTSMTPAGVALHDMAGETNAANKANDAYLASLSPLENAQRTLKIMEEGVSQAIKDHGAGSQEAVTAGDRYKVSQQEVARQEGLTQTAIHGVTQAMLDQANQALAAADSGFAYQDATYRTADAQQKLADAQAHLNDANVKTRTSQDDVTRATTALSEALSAQAGAAGKVAADSSGLTDKMDLQKVSAAGTLQELLKLRDQYGSAFPASLQTAIDKMEAAGVKLDWLGGMKPTPTVDANIDPLTGKTNTSLGLLGVLAGQTPTPVAGLATGMFGSQWQAAMNNIAYLDGQRPQPTPLINSGPFDAVYGALMGRLGTISGQRPSPVATLYANTSAAENAIDYAARNRTAYITTLYNTSNARGMALGGNVGRALRGFSDGGAPHRRSDGRIVGPGGPWDDLVPAVTSMGESIRVANSEWIVPGFVASRQGDARMSAFTAGRADIVPRGPSGRSDVGGSPNPATGTGQTNGGRTITVGTLNVTFAGADLSTDRQSMRKAALMLREEIIKLERETA